MPDDPASLSKLPPRCFAQLPSTGETIAIVCGEAGYHPVATRQTVEQLNALVPNPPTPEQIGAMLAGSMFGWHVLAAQLRDDCAAGLPVGRAAVEPPGATARKSTGE